MGDAAHAGATDAPPAVRGAKNEWVSFAVQLTGLPVGGNTPWHALRIQPVRRGPNDTADLPLEIEAYQIVSMPVDVNRAGYVRHTGISTASANLPRALLPLPMNRAGVIDLRALRPPKSLPGGNPAEPPRVWIDVKIAADAPPGDYAATVDLMRAQTKQPVASLPLALTVYDFALPAPRSLQLVGRLSWESLARLYPERFESVTPRLLNRTDSRYRGTIEVLDGLVALAQRHRAGLVIPRLQPTVKWPADQPPDVEWDDYDRLVAPWLNGQAFADRIPLGFWPMPAPDYLRQYDRASQLAYWSDAARHFGQYDWLGLNRSPIWMDKVTPGRARPADSVELSLQAGQLLRLHNRVRVALPLEDDQVQLTDRDNREMIDPQNAERLWAAAPGLVFSPPTQDWPENVTRPDYWLRTDLPGLVPYAGVGGDERDVRLWAWLAFLRHAGMIAWGDALPSLSSPAQPADPNETVWFYPGHWFGLDHPVPTVQLKWLRRAEQDFEYLNLAKERGEVLNALLMARLMTKPVEIQPGQAPDPAYGLMSGTTDAAAWDSVQQLLARTIQLRRPGQPVDLSEQHGLYVDTLRWAEPQERPMLMGRTVRWMWDTAVAAANANDKGNVKPVAAVAAAGPKALNLRLGVDIYNASDNTPDRNTLRWSALAPGWEVKPQPVQIPALATYNVRRQTMDARFELDKISAAARAPVEVTFTNGFTGRDSVAKLVLPVAASEHAEGRRLAVDGRLDEWDDADMIQDGPMVQMLSRPDLQRQELRFATTPARLYTAWGPDHFYLAFSLKGITPGNMLKGSQNFVDYQFRRAWGEDLCSVLIQPVYDDNRVGPVLHVVCKPTGSDWVERKLDPKQHANPWAPLEGTGVRYRTAIDGGNWAGEVAIPWKAIVENDAAVPTLLRFNFTQHHAATGESASWAGPVDFGRDDAFTGVLHLREAKNPGLLGINAAGGTSDPQ